MKNLFILPFDHRSSFARDLLGINEKPNKEQTQKVSELKEIVFNGFKKSRQNYPNKNCLGILVDWQFGSKIIKEAKKEKIVLSVPVEKSGQDVFDFEYGKKFGEYIKKADPDFVKVLVRYNPENIEANKRQLVKLKELSDFCKQNKYKLLFELLVPATEADLNICKTQARYDSTIRYQKTAQAIQEIKKLVKVDIWKLEGFKKEQWADIISVINKGSKIIILGRAGTKARVKQWLVDGMNYPEIIGFAVGRTIFHQHLQNYIANKITKQRAIDLISKDFNYFLEIWREN